MAARAAASTQAFIFPDTHYVDASCDHDWLRDWLWLCDLLLLLLKLANRLADFDIEPDRLCDCDLSRDSLMLRDSDLLMERDANCDCVCCALNDSLSDALRLLLNDCDLLWLIESDLLIDMLKLFD